MYISLALLDTFLKGCGINKGTGLTSARSTRVDCNRKGSKPFIVTVYLYLSWAGRDCRCAESKTLLYLRVVYGAIV